LLEEDHGADVCAKAYLDEVIERDDELVTCDVVNGSQRADLVTLRITEHKREAVSEVVFRIDLHDDDAAEWEWNVKEPRGSIIRISLALISQKLRAVTRHAVVVEGIARIRDDCAIREGAANGVGVGVDSVVAEILEVVKLVFIAISSGGIEQNNNIMTIEAIPSS
jgi:hypothetical protein